VSARGGGGRRAARGASRPASRAASRAASRPAAVTPALLRRWAIPAPDAAGDKESRGRVLVVGGAPSLPGAVVLAATAALRAGAGKLQIATGRDIATAVGIAVPESLVVALPETRAGAVAAGAARLLRQHVAHTQALLVGPGLTGDPGALLAALVRQVERATVVLDAGALAPLARRRSLLHRLRGRAVITPHVAEMATLLGLEPDEVEAAPLRVARDAARELRAVVALKGATTIIAAPDGRAWAYAAGDVGLATSGSGDTLAGIVAGLAARGCEPAQAAVWGVHVHGAAGNALGRRVGRVGFLARELLAEVPRVLQRLGGRRRRGGR